MAEEQDLFAGWGDTEETPTVPAETIEDSLDEDSEEIKNKEEKVVTEEETEAIEEQDDLFADFTDNDDKTEEIKKETKDVVSTDKVKSKSSVISSVNYLKDKGILSYELEEGQELTEELAEELLEDSFDNSVNDRLKEMMQDLPEEVKNIVNFATKGGNVSDILKAYSQESTFSENIDLDKESVQEQVVKQQLLKEGMDEDEAEDFIDYHKESGKLKMLAEKKFAKLKEESNTKKEALLKEQQKRAVEYKNQRKQLKKDFSSYISDAKQVKAYKISRKDKADLPGYIAEANIKLESGGAITGMQKDLQEALKDKEKTIFLAKLLKSDFNLKDLEANIETKITKKTRESVRRVSSADKDDNKGIGGIHEFF